MRQIQPRLRFHSVVSFTPMNSPLFSGLLLLLTPHALLARSPATPAAQVADAAVKHVTPQEAARELSAAATIPGKAIIVIDVRTPEEFAEGHIKDARNVDIASPDFQKNLAKLDPSKRYLVHCAAGGRSTRSLSLLIKAGFKSILHLDGGLNAWKEAGLPLEKTAPAK